MKKSIIILTVFMTVFSVHLFSDNSFNGTMGKIADEYLKIKDTLANDKTENVRENAQMILGFSKTLDVNSLSKKHKDHFKELPMKISKAAKGLSKAKKIKSMRKAFNDLSKPMAMWATSMKPKGINVAYCPMAPGSWLQKGKEIRNPYYGASMLKCGEIVSEGKKSCGSDCKKSCCDEKEMIGNHSCDEKCDHDSKIMKNKNCGKKPSEAKKHGCSDK